MLRTVHFLAAASALAAAGPARAADKFGDYVMYLPPGVNPVRSGVVNKDCLAYRGYHHNLGVNADGFAVVQRCSKAPVSEPQVTTAKSPSPSTVAQWSP